MILYFGREKVKQRKQIQCDASLKYRDNFNFEFVGAEHLNENSLIHGNFSFHCEVAFSTTSESEGLLFFRDEQIFFKLSFIFMPYLNLFP